MNVVCCENFKSLIRVFKGSFSIVTSYISFTVKNDLFPGSGLLSTELIILL